MLFRSHGLVFRKDPPKSIIETERGPEFRALQMFHPADGVPVPEALFLEEGGDAFGAPAFIMREIAGGEVHSGFDADPFGEAREQIGHDFFSALGKIAAADPGPLGLPPVSPADRVRHWQAVVEDDATGPEPVARIAADWLIENAPAPEPEPAVVHGDYRRGNFLVKGGRITAILDWEMVHVGDPLEDLAWACDDLWVSGGPNVAGTVPETEAIRIWEEASGRKVDAARYRWWKVFAQYMGLAIWISSEAEVVSGRSTQIPVIWAAIYPYRWHNHALAVSLRKAMENTA